MSPGTRRGRAATGSHRKPPSRGPVDAGKEPVAAPEAAVEEEAPAGAPPAPRGVRRRGATRVGRSSGFRNALRYTRAYIPLFVAFLGLFAAVWIYRSFVNPPPPEPQQVWTRIEAKYTPQIDAARLKIDDPKSDFATKIAGFTALRNGLSGWMGELALITDWTVGATSSAEYSAAGQAGQDITSLVQTGIQEVTDLDNAVKATTEAGLADYATALKNDDAAFQQGWILVRQDFGLAVPAAQATLALPPAPSPSPSAGSSGSPAPSGSPAVSPTPGSSPSAGPPASAGPSASPTAKPS